MRCTDVLVPRHSWRRIPFAFTPSWSIPSFSCLFTLGQNRVVDWICFQQNPMPCKCRDTSPGKGSESQDVGTLEGNQPRFRRVQQDEQGSGVNSKETLGNGGEVSAVLHIKSLQVVVNKHSLTFIRIEASKTRSCVRNTRVTIRGLVFTDFSTLFSAPELVSQPEGMALSMRCFSVRTWLFVTFRKT